MFLRVLLLVCALATSGVVPALAWAQASDPCTGGSHAIHEHEGEDDETCADDCRAACQCPCCPVRVRHTAPELAPRVAAPTPEPLAFAPAGRPAAGVRAEIFHPPSL